MKDVISQRDNFAHLNPSNDYQLLDRSYNFGSNMFFLDDFPLILDLKVFTTIKSNNKVDWNLKQEFLDWPQLAVDTKGLLSILSVPQTTFIQS